MAADPSQPAPVRQAVAPIPKSKTPKTGKSQRDPFEVDLDEDQEKDLVDFLCRELDYAEAARVSIVGDNGRLDQAHMMYEGGDGLTKNTPWPGAANLGSFIVTEKVDSMRARIVATLFTDPVWIVEGWGDAAEKAPFVEAFHQWKTDQEKLQTFLSRVTHNSLIEGMGVLEISDRVVLRKGVRRMKALLQRDHNTGATMLDEKGHPVPVVLKNGKYAEASGDDPHIEIVVNDVVRATAGPSFRVLSLKNFFLMPGHASEREDVWGYAKRFFRRLPDLQCRQRDGFYKNVDDLGKGDERIGSGVATDGPRLLREGQDIAPQYDVTAEKEIWEVTFLADLDEDGYDEWYVATLSKTAKTLLRVQYQDYGTPHYITFTPFPRPNSVYGYSYASDKLGSLYDEHSALRNMFADRSALAVSAPFMQVQGSEWNPALKPFGPRQVIPVRDPSELKQLEIRDVPQSVMMGLQMVLQAAERLSGQNDTSTGHLAQQDRTLGEIKISTEQSFVRIDEVVKNFQEGMEDLFDLHHIIWKNKLAAEPEPMPGDMLASMQERGIQIDDTTITADMLDGAFRGKPHGSVQSADYSQMRADFAQLLTALTQLAQGVPALRAHLNNPVIVRSIISQLARVYSWPDRANLVAKFGTPDEQQPQGPPPEVQMKQMELASKEKLEIQLKAMDNAKAIAVARITAGKAVFDAALAAQEEALAEAQATTPPPDNSAAGAPPPGMIPPPATGAAPLAGAPSNATPGQ